jgi:hypothetical protein
MSEAEVIFKICYHAVFRRSVKDFLMINKFCLPLITCSFLHCSELCLNSHLLLQQLDSFEDVLNNLTEKYFDLCFGHLEYDNKVEEEEVCNMRCFK